MIEKRRKELYFEFCNSETGIPVYSKPWWLDAVCGEENWDVLLYHEADELIASMPYYLTRKLFSKVIKMPILTQALGIYIKYPVNLSSNNKLSLEKKIYSYFISILPKVGAQFHNFHYSATNWLPFFWNGYRQTTRYTYVIEDISDAGKVFDNFSHAKQKNIRKSEKLLDVKFDLSPKDFYNLHHYTLKQHRSRIVYSFETFKRLYESAYTNNAGRTIYAVDDDKVIHSAIFCVWDDNSAYDLISTIDKDYRNSGSASLLVWELIKLLSNKVNKFDFEGSMDESVEKSFRQFGAIQYPYFRVYRIDNPVLKLAYQFA
ncbi:MAG TPA: GNAT family N-acetyltransferase [Bacteroidales bacterium]|nr:GNAT family N-acetyltransferase [Bacteroidales bacterium]